MKTSTRWLCFVLLLTLGTVPSWADGPGEIGFDESTVEATEASGMAVIVVERRRGEDGAVSASYTTSDGSAVAGEDYSSASGTVEWSDGDESEKVITVPILSDGVDEGAESFFVTLSEPEGGATLGRNPVRVIIKGTHDDDDDEEDDDEEDDEEDDGEDGGKAGVLKFDQKNFLALETSGVAVITVERSKGERGAVSVDYATADGTATAGADYEATSGTLSWDAGDGGTKTFTIPVVDDGEGEGSETVHLVLSNPTGGAGLDDERSQAILTIFDDDGGNGGDDEEDDGSRPGVIKFDERRAQTVEGAENAVIVVERSKGEHGTVSVDYASADGSATDGEDYEGVSGTLSWGPGDESHRLIVVPVLEDDMPEGNETVFLTLSNPTGGATVDPERGESILTILDNDGDTSPCNDDSTTLCLLSGRFRVEVVWRASNGDTGQGTAIPVSDTSGLFWFFSSDNIEMLFKVLDACQLPGFENFWVFFAATTNVDFTVTVTDTVSGVVKEYANPTGQAAEPVQDTLTFNTCP